MERKKRKIKSSVVVAILMTILIVLVLLTMMTIMDLQSTRRADSITYNQSASLTPSVCLYVNDYLPNDCSTENKSYVASLIKKISVELKGDMSASDILKTNTYTYSIEARVLATEKGDSSKVVYDNTEVLDSGTATTDGTTTYTFDKAVDIDFTKYNATITNFKKSYVLALDSDVIVTAKIDTNATSDKLDSAINNTQTISISIPLTEQTVNIDTTSSTYNVSKTITNSSDNSRFEMETKSIYWLYGIDALFIAFAFWCIWKMMPKQSAYERRLNGILKEYDRAIAVTDNVPSLRGMEVIDIDSFEELLDVKDNIGKPILFNEDKSSMTSKFIILNQKEAYIYTLSGYDLVK